MEPSDREFCTKHNMKRTKHEIFDHVVYSCSECSKEEEIAEKERKEEERKEMEQREINKRLHNSMITPRFRDKNLDNYISENEGQKKALKIAKWFIDNIESAPSLIFLGKPGTGKNHLASGIVKEVIRNHNKTALVTEAIKIIRDIKESWQDRELKEHEVIREYIRPDLLVIDEIGVQFGSDTEKLYLSEIINDRYNYKKATIILGNLTKDELAETIGDRILDRFRENGKMFIFDWDSHRSKVN